MRKFFVKLDLKAFKITEKYVLYRVHKTKKNKFYIFAGMYKKLMALWLLLCVHQVIFVMYEPISFAEKGLTIAVIAFVAMIWAGPALSHFINCSETAAIYDHIFLIRNSFNVYESTKRLCRHFWLRGKQNRLLDLKVRSGFLLLILIISIFRSNAFGRIGDALMVLDFCAINVMALYKFAIFDMDPPKPKIRKKETLTELMQKAWQSLIKNPLPSAS